MLTPPELQAIRDREQKATGEAALDEAITRQKHMVDCPHRLKSYQVPTLVPAAFGGPSYNWLQMNCGRDDCWLPEKDPEFFTLDEC